METPTYIVAWIAQKNCIQILEQVGAPHEVQQKRGLQNMLKNYCSERKYPRKKINLLVPKSTPRKTLDIRGTLLLFIERFIEEMFQSAENPKENTFDSPRAFLARGTEKLYWAKTT